MLNYSRIAVDPSEYLDIEALYNAPVLGFDVETTGTHIFKDEHLGASMAYRRDDAIYVPPDHPFNLLLTNPNITKVAHNAAFDRNMMKKIGISIDENLVCTQVAAHMVQSARMPMETDADGNIVYSMTDSPLNLYTQSMKWNNFPVQRFPELGMMNLSFATMDQLCAYSGPHSIATLLLWETLRKELIKSGVYNAYMNIEMPFLPVIADIMYNGVLIDRSVLDDLDKELAAQQTELQSELNIIAGKEMNHNSPDQVRTLLYDEFKLPAPRRTTKSGKLSTDKKYLADIADKHPYIPKYLEYKELTTLRTSYTTSLVRDICSDGRIYGSFNQTGTGTSRLSSSHPNLQKIPARTETGKLIRKAFTVPEDCVYVKVDYDQIELRIVAVAAGIQGLIDAFANNRDPHQETGDRVFPSSMHPAERRRKGKTKNFQLVYGGGDPAEKAILEEAYPELSKWKRAFIYGDGEVPGCLELGCAYTMGGRKRVLPDLVAGNRRIFEHGSREAVSTHIQGSASEKVKVGMARCYQELRKRGMDEVKMVLQVHDEAGFEVPKYALVDTLEVIKETMPIYDFPIPLTVGVEVGRNWGEVKEVHI